MTDYSFIALFPTIEQAQREGLPKHVQIIDNQHVVLHPNKTYCQISNVPNGISFDGSAARVYITDCCGFELIEITDNVFITEFTHDTNGTNQIGFEISELGIEKGGKELRLKFVDEDNSGNVWYSSSVVCTATLERESFELGYFSKRTIHGISYINSGLDQYIQIARFYKSKLPNTVSSTSYTQSSRYADRQVEITANMHIQDGGTFQFDSISECAYRKLQVLFSHDVVYIDGVRVTNKPVLSELAFSGQTNVGYPEFTASFNYSDTYQYVPQLQPVLEAFQFDPSGQYLPSAAPTSATITFNMPIVLNTGVITLYKDGAVLATFDETDVTNTGSALTFPLGSLGVGVYYFTMQFGMVEGYSGFSDSNTWAFSIQQPDYDSDDYDSNDYFA